jgi:hypothetical protein
VLYFSGLAVDPMETAIKTVITAMDAMKDKLLLLFSSFYSLSLESVVERVSMILINISPKIKIRQLTRFFTPYMLKRPWDILCSVNSEARLNPHD